MDVLLSVDLDVVIPNDVGLMTGIDEVCDFFNIKYCIVFTIVLKASLK